jgi:hypothetical protein
VLVARLCKEAPIGPLLRNSAGNAWTKNATNCAFFRLQLALGKRAMQELGIEAKTPPRFRSASIAPEGLAEAKKHAAAMRRARSENTRLAREHGLKYHLRAILRSGKPHQVKTLRLEATRAPRRCD